MENTSSSRVLGGQGSLSNKIKQTASFEKRIVIKDMVLWRKQIHFTLVAFLIFRMLKSFCKHLDKS